MVVPIFLAVVVAQVDYDTEIQPIWNSNCASCHTSTHSSGLNLTSGNSFDGLVDVTSTNYSPALRVASGDPGSSVLYDKITGGGSYGGQMPPYGAGGLMSEANRSLVQTWITELSSANYITIAAARAEGDGASVTVRGMVTTPNYQTDHTEYGLQDGTGGLVIFHYGSPYVTLAVGDSVEVSGTLDEYNGKLEVIPENADDITVISSNNSLPAFQVLTVANFVANGEDYESELIRINSTSITSGTWPTSSSANLTISDDGGSSTLVMRIDSDTEIIGNPEPVAPFDLLGIAGQYNDDYQILPRYYSDFMESSVTEPTNDSLFYDGFENYNDFAISSIGNWYMVDNDGGTTWGSTSYDFQNEGYVGSGIIFAKDHFIRVAAQDLILTGGLENWVKERI